MLIHWPWASLPRLKWPRQILFELYIYWKYTNGYSCVYTISMNQGCPYEYFLVNRFSAWILHGYFDPGMLSVHSVLGLSTRDGTLLLSNFQCAWVRKCSQQGGEDWGGRLAHAPLGQDVRRTGACLLLWIRTDCLISQRQRVFMIKSIRTFSQETKRLFGRTKQ